MAEGLLARWDDAVADETFAMNLDLDEPRDLRRAAVEKVAADLGPFRRDEDRAAVSASAAHLRWWLRGERGWAELEILVTPEAEPRLQTFRVTPVGDPSAALVAAAERLLGAAAGPGPTTWPAGLARVGTLDPVPVERALQAGAARFGTMALGRPTGGDGTTSATWALVTERGRATLKVALDQESGAVTEAALRVAHLAPPDDAW